MLEVFPQERGTIRPARDCAACCFFHLVETKGKRRRICQLTGEKRPWAGMDGCNFIQGQWSQIDRILGLPSLDFSGNTGDPIQMKPGSGFSRNGEIVAKTQIALVDFSAKLPIYHTKLKAEKAIRRSGTREGRRLI